MSRSRRLVVAMAFGVLCTAGMTIAAVLAL